ncbi:hypothetical protein JB92DRAFT_2947033, partial [Gautieria morchelliformis]
MRSHAQLCWLVNVVPRYHPQAVRYQTSKRGTCPSGPSPLPTFPASLHPPMPHIAL